jgi:hypothetical protein
MPVIDRFPGLARRASHEVPARTARRVPLFKRDHPRSIDRYIDFFGGGAADQEPVALLEVLGAPPGRQP